MSESRREAGEVARLLQRLIAVQQQAGLRDRERDRPAAAVRIDVRPFAAAIADRDVDIALAHVLDAVGRGNAHLDLRMLARKSKSRGTSHFEASGGEER